MDKKEEIKPTPTTNNVSKDLATTKTTSLLPPKESPVVSPSTSFDKTEPSVPNTKKDSNIEKKEVSSASTHQIATTNTPDETKSKSEAVSNAPSSNTPTSLSSAPSKDLPTTSPTPTVSAPATSLKSNENPNLQSVAVPSKDPSSTTDSPSSNNQTVIEVPKFEIPAEKKEEVPIEGAKNELASFSTIFNQESEEKSEEKNRSVTAPQISINAQEKAIVEEAKAKLKAEQDKAAQAIIDQKNAEETAKRKKIEAAKNFNDKEKVVFTINEEKQGSPLVVVGFFLILATFVIILPKISKLDTIDFSTPITTNTTEETETTDDYYYFNRTSETQIGDLTISNLVKSTKNNEYFVSLTVTNNSEKNYFFDKKYYIVFYQDTTIIYRALLHSYDAVGSLEAIDLTLVINQKAYESADRIKMEEIETVRYPDVSLGTSDGDYKVLSCTYQTDEMKYYFYNDGLQKISEVYTVTKSSNNNYQTLKEQYKTLYNKYNQIENFTSLFIETDTDFEIHNEIDLKEIPDQTISNLKTYKFFKYNETPEIVSFEIEAQGYTCS